MRDTVIAVVAALVVGHPACLHAQQLPVIEPGEWVRIAINQGSSAEPLVVRCTAIRQDSLEFRYRTATRVVPLDSLIRVERWHSNSHIADGVLWGGGVGLLLGAVVGASWCDYYGYGCGEAITVLAALGAAGGVAVGALIGGVVGTLAGSRGWEAVPLDQLRLQPLASVEGRFGLAASLRF